MALKKLSFVPKPETKNTKIHRVQDKPLHELLRCGFLNHYEIAVLSVVGSHACGSFMTLEELCWATKISRRKAQYVVKTLIATGLLRKRYFSYKRMHIWITTQDCQRYWLDHVHDTSKPWPGDLVPVS
jgi:predicted DNA-binding transcriptional regulator